MRRAFRKLKALCNVLNGVQIPLQRGEESSRRSLASGLNFWRNLADQKSTIASGHQ